MSLCWFSLIQLNGFNYFYLIQIILFTINHLFAQSWWFKYCYISLTIRYQSFVYTQLNVKTILFQTIRFSISTQFKCQNSIWSIDRILSSAANLGQNGPGSDDNEGVLRIPQSFSIIGASLSDCLTSWCGHLSGESYPSAEMQSVYSTAPTDWPNLPIEGV